MPLLRTALATEVLFVPPFPPVRPARHRHYNRCLWLRRRSFSSFL